MSTHYESRYAIGPTEAKALDTPGLRQQFLIEQVFSDEIVRWVYTHYARCRAAGAMLVDHALELETIDPLIAGYFLERRELGIINVGDKGKVPVDRSVYELDFKEALYIGRGSEQVMFSSD